MSRHTPGPWSVEDPMGAEIGLSIVQEGLKTYEWEFIAMVCQTDLSNDSKDLRRIITLEEQEANARLIAAAPELLEALKMLLANLTEGEFISETRIDAARAAIAKAEATT